MNNRIQLRKLLQLGPKTLNWNCRGWKPAIALPMAVLPASYVHTYVHWLEACGAVILMREVEPEEPYREEPYKGGKSRETYAP